MEYNLLTQSWIRVRYLDGTVSKIGIRQALKDASLISGILSPVFRHEAISIYEVPVYKLLSTIVMSAYYKPETKFASKNLRYLETLKTEGLYSKVVEKYLDSFGSRFDIYSEQHPFLQNPLLKDKFPDYNEPSDKYKSWNIMVPADNCQVFGRYRSLAADCEKPLDQYTFSNEEFAYMLLYFSYCAHSPNASWYKEKSLSAGASVFIIPKGKTLAETIIRNIMPLKTSSRPLEDNVKADAPIWELDNIFEVCEYPSTTIPKNLLLCTFWPGISVLGIPKEDNTGIKNILRPVYQIQNGKNGWKEEFSNVSLNPDITNAVTDQYCDPHSVISKFISKKDKSEYVGYVAFSDDLECFTKPATVVTASALCICATGVTDQHLNCPVLENQDSSDGRISVYYRIYDLHKCNIQSFGYLDGRNYATWQIIKNPENHENAVAYQNYYAKVRIYLEFAFKKLYDNSKITEKQAEQEDEETGFRNTLAEKAYANAARSFSDFVERDFFTLFTDDILNGNDVLNNAADRLNDAAVSSFIDATRYYAKVFELADVTSWLKSLLRKEKEKL